MKSRWKIASNKRFPRPGSAKSCSMTTVPPIKPAILSPTIVVSVNELGRNACLKRINRSLSPFDLAERT